MKKLTREEMKKVDGGLYACIALYDVLYSKIRHANYSGKYHTDYSMRCVKFNNSYINIFGH